MNEQKVQVLKSIGFPLKVLSCIDKAAALEQISRSAFVVKAVSEFIKNNGLEERTGIKIYT